MSGVMAVVVVAELAVAAAALYVTWYFNEDLNDPQKQEQLNKDIARLGTALGKLQSRIGEVTTKEASEARKNLGRVEEYLTDLKKGLEKNGSAVSQPYLRKVERLLAGVQSVSNDLTKQVARGKEAASGVNTNTNDLRCLPEDPLMKVARDALKSLGENAAQNIADGVLDEFKDAIKDGGISPKLKEALGKSLGKRYEDLTPDVKKELVKGYKITIDENGKVKSIAVTNSRLSRKANPTPPRLAIVDGKIVPATQGRISQGDLGKLFAKVQGIDIRVTSITEGLTKETKASVKAGLKLDSVLQVHHIIPDAVWQQFKPLNEAFKKAVITVDHGKNLTMMFKDSAAKGEYKKLLQNLKQYPEQYAEVRKRVNTLGQRGAFLENLYHSGSHDKWSTYVKEVITKELKGLGKKGKSLETMTQAEVKQFYEKITGKLQGELKQADESIVSKQQTPNWVDDKCDRLSEIGNPSRNNVALTPGQQEQANRESLAASIAQLEATREMLAAKLAELKPPTLPPIVESQQIARVPRNRDSQLSL